MKLKSETIGVITIKTLTINGELLNFYKMKRDLDKKMIVVPTTVEYYKKFLRLEDTVRIKNCRDGSCI